MSQKMICLAVCFKSAHGWGVYKRPIPTLHSLIDMLIRTEGIYLTIVSLDSRNLSSVNNRRILDNSQKLGPLPSCL